MVEYGSDVDLHCVIESVLSSLTINWTSTIASDPLLIPVTTSNATTTISTVTLRNVTFDNDGEYDCSAEDDEDSFSTYFTVSIEGMSSYIFDGCFSQIHILYPKCPHLVLQLIPQP